MVAVRVNLSSGELRNCCCYVYAYCYYVYAYRHMHMP